MTSPISSPAAANTVIRWLAEAGVSIAGTRAMRVRGRSTGSQRAVVVNLMTVDGVDYLVSPRGNTQWARNARAAGSRRGRAALASPLADASRNCPTTPSRRCSNGT